MSEHPIEVARRALKEAATLEVDEDWSFLLRRMARSLPDRSCVAGPPSPETPKAHTPAHSYWTKVTTIFERERQVLEAIGDERMTSTEIFGAVRTSAGHPEVFVAGSSVDSIITRLFKTREVDRVAENWRNRKRYRYFRRAELDGPIVDLQRMLDDQGA